MAFIRRDKKSSSLELVEAIRQLAPLLKNQDDHEAADFLLNSAALLEKQPLGSNEFTRTIVGIIDSFEGEFELMAYTLKESDPRSWSEADELAVASNRVLALARRLK